MNRRGVALIVVLWLMAVLTLLMYSFLGEMQVEYALAGGFAAEKQAEQLAWSAVDAACAMVQNDVRSWHGLSDSWSNDRDQFFEVPLGDGAYTVLHPPYDESTRPMWGLEDEASKININTAPIEILRDLPLISQNAAAIIDWRDADSTPGEGGGEDEYYQTLDPPYRCKNQPFETVEELLFVRGMTPQILYGEDANLNGVLDPNENDGDKNFPPDNRDGRLDAGLYGLVTVVSRDLNISAEGQPRVNVNSAGPDQLRAAFLTNNEIQSIMGYRATQGPFRSLAHLLDILSKARFKAVVDRLTIFDGEAVPGLVNVNTAPKAVLLALPEMTEALAEKIIAQRAVPGADLSTMGWLTDVATTQELKNFSAYVTFRSQQFRIHAIGRVGTPYGTTSASEAEGGRPGIFKRMVAVFDLMADPEPRLVYWKDVTKLGMPYDPQDGP